MYIQIPKEVDYIIRKIENHGYEAFIVGGCVRDSLLGKIPSDFDITTNANPQTILKIFQDDYAIPTGLKYGTITVVINNQSFEITTYRIEGDYSDNRRPDNIEYTNSLIEDLKRRDFTINAMAYNKTIGLVDKFDGKIDLDKKIIKTVGNPDERFKEDALRMLRAIRFSAQLNFNIHKDTKGAIKKNSALIKDISKERIKVEIDKILLSNNPEKIYLMHNLNLLKYISLNLDKYIQDPISKNALKSLKYIDKTLHLRLAALLCDIIQLDEFKENSLEICVQILKYLRYDKFTIQKLKAIMPFINIKIYKTKPDIKKLLNKLGKDNFKDLLKIKWARCISQNIVNSGEKTKDIYEIKQIFDQIISNKECFTVKDLDINGKDIISLGCKEGQKVGIILNKLLDLVIQDPSLNNREHLLDITTKHFL
ncbi:tRNA nucleotidyltransferase (CCA-adding enzyme) [Alkalithermobacter thermoalcaliphilus JW-YL-7 = DSM 7308]|uniref:Polynucleotide adenylyltransferase region n=1 Tax=Alkalithermobacter thermoalcaliphilus JW-YL-7 = DSM 7308 TaxID=1121328 RepID=A0A150FPU9_CLOPD|nr:Polynucleotide adenylyltransferase region [[Clostridium] paradoxum JW-YL-7 = DSM 7308]SHK65860.1 tRNA nucleotidyltransferase (CCA-adding enzyme) [[Clostridium] paradoxum JW-YL-7 = DSM 7308]